MKKLFTLLSLSLISILSFAGGDKYHPKKKNVLPFPNTIMDGTTPTLRQVIASGNTTPDGKKIIFGGTVPSGTEDFSFQGSGGVYVANAFIVNNAINTTTRSIFGGDWMFSTTAGFTGLNVSTVPYLDASKKLASSAVTPTELGYVSGVTSAIQTQFSAKKTIATGNNYKFETTGASGLLQETSVTASRAVVTDANGLPSASATTATELSYVNGVTSSIQTQINNLSGTGWLQNGNTVGAEKWIGTIDNYALPFRTNNVEAGRILNTGEWTIADGTRSAVMNLSALGDNSANLQLNLSSGGSQKGSFNFNHTDGRTYLTAGTGGTTLELSSNNGTNYLYMSGAYNQFNAPLQIDGDVNPRSLTFQNTAINTTAGDAATINGSAGRFRKDNSGSTFTLTNSFITANSIITLSFASDVSVTGNQVSVVAGAGSAVISFWTVGVGAGAPAANQDVNFIVVN